MQVNSNFDETGYMKPLSIVWNNRAYPIQEVISFRPAAAQKDSFHGDCYTIRISGEEKHLFFEKTDPRFSSRFGRWFVESTI